MQSSEREFPPDFRVAIARRSQTKAGEAEVILSPWRWVAGEAGGCEHRGRGRGGRKCVPYSRWCGKPPRSRRRPRADVFSATGGGGELLCSHRQRGCRVEGALALQQEPKKFKQANGAAIQSEHVVAT